MKESIMDYEKLLMDIYDLIECEALEFIEGKQTDVHHLYMPYMMNDAVEYYYVFTNIHVEGKLHQAFSAATNAEICSGTKKQLILTGPEEVRLSFDSCLREVHFYQYHRIGHFWKNGQEQWRQLVYMIGTIFDKYVYLGDFACNDAEQFIMWLITFAPFRYWSPVHESLESKYPDSSKGLDCMYQIAKDVKDYALMGMLRQYKKCLEMPFVSAAPMEKKLAEALIEPEHIELYEYIYEYICKASSVYKVRNYGEDQNRQIEKYRQCVDHDLKRCGYTGTYPEYRRAHYYVLATEEHPFTILENEDFIFNIHLMISESSSEYVERNEGFFGEKGNCGRIVKYKYCIE